MSQMPISVLAVAHLQHDVGRRCLSTPAGVGRPPDDGHGGEFAASCRGCPPRRFGFAGADRIPESRACSSISAGSEVIVHLTGSSLDYLDRPGLLFLTLSMPGRKHNQDDGSGHAAQSPIGAYRSISHPPPSDRRNLLRSVCRASAGAGRAAVAPKSRTVTAFVDQTKVASPYPTLVQSRRRRRQALFFRTQGPISGEGAACARDAWRRPTPSARAASTCGGNPQG